jgi:GNAT superfamily N-acetyltransferase
VDEKARMREADPSDVPGLDIVRRQAIESGFTDSYDRDAFADLVARPDPKLREWIDSDRVLVLVVSSEMTPFCFGVFDPEAGEVKGLYSAENYEGEGHAARILEQFEDVARNRGLTELRVEAPRNARGFFEHHGFEARGPVESEETGLTLVEMTKPLTD